MSRLPRRTFLKSLSLGASAPLLAPLVGRLEAETRGVRPMRFVFVVEGNGLPAKHVQPIGIVRKVQKNHRSLDLVYRLIAALEKEIDAFDFSSERETFARRLSPVMRKTLTEYIADK
jgi:hypothetical protein